MPTVGQIVEFLDRFAPRSLAESWDNVGLLLGDRATEVTGVMTCLTVTPATAREAIDQNAQLVVSHHPVLFRPVQRLTADEPSGRMLLELIRAGVSVYSPHTAFDGTAGGINEILAERLGLTSLKPMRPTQQEERVKVVVFVPSGDLEPVSRAMFEAGAGVIGEYRECSFRVAGRGTFLGSQQSHPTIGQPGRPEECEEWRFEVVCPAVHADRVVAAARSAHSYEEPAYDVYPLARTPGSVGAGRWGELSKPIALADFARRVRQQLASALVQVVGSRDRAVKRIAIACGSGGEFLPDAAGLRCDALVTGEASFHRLLEAEASGIALVLAGHYATERLGVERLQELIAHAFPSMRVWSSSTEHDPAWVVNA